MILGIIKDLTTEDNGEELEDMLAVYVLGFVEWRMEGDWIVDVVNTEDKNDIYIRLCHVGDNHTCIILRANRDYDSNKQRFDLMFCKDFQAESHAEDKAENFSVELHMWEALRSY